MAPVKIHFPFLRPDREPIDLAMALGAEGFAPPRGPAGPEAGRYRRFNLEIPRDFAVAGIDQADAVVFPYCALNHPVEVEQTAELARRRGLPCVFLAWGDASTPLQVSYGTVYRQSLIAGHARPNERALPAFCSDVLEERGQPLAPRPWREMPVIGFCGYVGTPLLRGLYRLRGQRRKAMGLKLRATALKLLEHPRSRSIPPRIRTRFIRRKRFLAATRGGAYDPAGQFEVRREFLDNLLECDYSLCMRGAGNFSIRFYETLSAGRIPLLINTQCVMPFEQAIDWRRHCVWVEESEMAAAADMLSDFHHQLDEQRFNEMQASNRRLWEQWLSPQAFFRHALSPDAR